MLEELDQNLVTASSGDEALRQVLEREFAVILLDVNMPGIDGLETAALIRSRKKSAHTPIIFITADYGDEMRMTQGYSLGAVDYIASPVVPEILRAKVRVFVELFLLAEQAKRQAQERIALVEEKAAREAAERASRRLAFLAEASGTLASSLDLEATLRELSRLIVPRFADVCLVSLAPGEGQTERHEMAWATSDPGHPLLDGVDPRDRRSRCCDEAIARVRGVRQAGVRSSAILRDRRRSRIALPRGLTAHALLLVPLARAWPHARRADARARSAGAPLRCGYARDGGRARDARGDRARQRAAVPQDPGRGPAQERVPRDARARAAQSAGADQQRRAHPARQRRRSGESSHGRAS